MKIVALFATSLLLVGALEVGAQSPEAATEKPPLPSGPIIRALPERAAWTVTYKSLEEKVDSPSGQSGQRETGEPAKILPRSISVVKTGEIYKEQERDVLGQNWIRWYWSGRGFSFTTEGKCIIDTAPVASPGFSEFSWISPSNYKGVSAVGSEKSYIFEDNIRMPEVEGLVPVKAVVGIESRLPVQLVVGGESRVFEFGAAPDAPLVVPKEIPELLQQQKKLGEALMRRPR